ncbi:hypothetical protein X770_27240 [Mesorhizobium sp. LSJC269B00]|nr:hypothetical protein X770_27240 [Mesorhizobium sp. LSJC269B00]
MLSDPVLSASGGFENDLLPAGCLRRSRWPTCVAAS